MSSSSQTSESKAPSFAVLGAGPMGLTCCYELVRRGAKVTVYEADDRIGGMSASFDFDGLTIERYYHFICATDRSLFQLLDELDLAKALKWVDTRMGFFYRGTLYEWGRPDRLLSFPHLGLSAKIRYALHVYYAKSIRDWRRLDRVEATEWLRRWVGEEAYDVLWRPLFELKFYEYAQSLSAAWIGTRIQRVAKSRRSMFQERLGTLDGGSDTLLRALEARILAGGGSIRLKSRVREVVAEEGRAVGVRVDGGVERYDAVISTIPLPYVPRMVPALPESERRRIAAIDNIAVACAILKLRRPVSPYFWMNIADPAIAIPGVIEYSNLHPCGAHILYAPYYMPKTHPNWRRADAELIAEVKSCLRRINPGFEDDWVAAERVSRYEFAQTVCGPGFFDRLPPMKSRLEGFYMADTSYYYPEDRSISESVAVGRRLAAIAAAG
jgi:protoporphyrinogen oxidase